MDDYKNILYRKNAKMLQRNVKTIDMPDYVFILPRDKWMLWE